MQIPVKANIQSSINSFLTAETLSGENAYFCNFCNSYESALISCKLSSVGTFLILQTKRFLQNGSAMVKQLQKIACNQTLSVPIVCHNTPESKKFKLLGTINHSGSLNRGHYTAFIKIPNTKSWLHCNDAAVLEAKEREVDNNSSYIYFFELHK